MLLLDNEHLQQYCEIADRSCCDGELLDALSKGQMAIEEERDESAETRVMSMVARFSDSRLSLTIAPTLGCNFCCPYCYEKGQEQATMSDETADDLVSFISERYRHVHRLDIGWYGGEPLLCLDRIVELTDRIKGVVGSECSYRAAIVTNGYLLSEDVAKTLKQCDVKMMQVTLDGSKRNHDNRRILHSGAPTYETILGNIAKCADMIHVSIRINVDKSNVDEAGEILLHLESRGLKNKVSFYLAPVDNINDTCVNSFDCLGMKEFSEKEAHFYRDAIQGGFAVDFWNAANPTICGAVSLNSYVVDPKGFLYKCWDEIGSEEARVGSLKQGPYFNARHIKWLDYQPGGSECESCFAFPVCMGGCPNHALHGDGKRCASLKYNIRQRLMLAEKQHGSSLAIA